MAIAEAASVYRLKIKSTASANIHVLVIHFLTCAVLVQCPEIYFSLIRRRSQL